MKQHVVVLGSLMAMAATSALAQQAPKDIQAFYTKIEKAFNAEDVKTIMACGTKDFKFKQKNGPATDAKATGEMLKAQFDAPGKMKTTMKIESCKVTGNTATVVGTMNMAGKMPGPDGKPHEMTGWSKTKDSLVKEGGQWKIKLIDTLEEKMTMDGKPFNPAAMSGGAPPPPSKAPKKGKH